MEFDISIYWDALTSSEFLHGAFLTITLALASQIAATVIGFFLALSRIAGFLPLRWGSAVYVWIWRAIPTLLWLLLIWNALPAAHTCFDRGVVHAVHRRLRRTVSG